MGDSLSKERLIPHVIVRLKVASCMLPLRDGLAAYQLVGEVKAHQGDDG